MWKSPQTPSEIILHGLNIAISRQRIAPLIRCLELTLTTLSRERHQGITLFSCDSFCSPHLKTQLTFFEALDRISDGKTNFLNVPVAHYITSIPQIDVLRNTQQTEKLLSVNAQMTNSQVDFLGSVPDGKRVSISHDKSYIISALFDRLTQIVASSEWQEVMINKFPFHELSLRDLSLTYKLTPELCQEPSKPFYEHFILSNQFNVWLLMQLIINSGHIGAIGVAMSFYTATTVFRFFCRHTSRISRFFGPSSLTSIDLGIQHDNLICLLDSPVSLCGLTSESNSNLLKSIDINAKVRASLDEYLSSRVKGYGTHTYSPPGETGSDAELDLYDWIRSQRQQGKTICSAFTSSQDETIGQNLGYNHENADLSHLNQSIFLDQDGWLRCLITYFKELETSASLVIRIHPRLGRDKRGLPESPSLQDHLKNIITEIGECSSIKLVYPHSAISSYQLGMGSDLILNGWSTIGLEFAMMGKLVCNAFFKCAHGGAAIYPVQLQSTPFRTTDDYKARIARLIQATQAIHCTSDEVIGADEARKAFLSANLCGLTDIRDDSALRSQIAMPVLLTPLLFKLLGYSN